MTFQAVLRFYHWSRFRMGFGSSQLRGFWGSPSPNPPSSGAAATPGDSCKHEAERLAELLWYESNLFSVQQGQEQLVLNTMSGKKKFPLPLLHGSQSPALHELPAWTPTLTSPSTTSIPRSTLVCAPSLCAGAVPSRPIPLWSSPDNGGCVRQHHPALAAHLHAQARQQLSCCAASRTHSCPGTKGSPAIAAPKAGMRFVRASLWG